MRKRRITTIWQLMEPHTSNQSNGSNSFNPLPRIGEQAADFYG
jgi:hypothetical protein